VKKKGSLDLPPWEYSPKPFGRKGPLKGKEFIFRCQKDLENALIQPRLTTISPQRVFNLVRNLRERPTLLIKF